MTIPPHQTHNPSSPATTDNPSPSLFHTSPNPTSTSPTILFLHGLCSSHLEFVSVIPHLTSTHHILLADLPGHSRSASITGPFNIDRAANLVADLIHQHATGGRAHVVGMSLGGFVALRLLRDHPELVHTAWVTGAAPFAGIRRRLAGVPAVMYSTLKGFAALPTAAYSALTRWMGMRPHEELHVEMYGNTAWALVASGFASVLEVHREDSVEVGRRGVRVLTVAGAAQDDVGATREQGEDLRSGGCADCRAVKVEKAIHAWDLQFPELFAEGVRAWVGDDTWEKLPKEYVYL